MVSGWGGKEGDEEELRRREREKVDGDQNALLDGEGKEGRMVRGMVWRCRERQEDGGFGGELGNICLFSML